VYWTTTFVLSVKITENGSISDALTENNKISSWVREGGITEQKVNNGEI